MTWLGYLNFVVLQWFFVRYARVTDDRGETVGFRWLGPILPLSGWWSDYRWVKLRKGRSNG